ncbi:arginine--tRNA ligase [Luteithermobacter gelatinilyticus]|uniref:arginine--tRNA ligase n=1 Tax=Luteithermobacter gelatinilyticus TaxID=2582913 RepID=UPI0011074AB0|nr:arginine--tRNA ligase [Luteithermobacter gelatinilyticus]|tara:strand:- start:810 stop:2561 length:1752 start_codon:yes stop_codon:yes gene_type:complete
MNIYKDLHEKVKNIIEILSEEGKLPGGLDLVAMTVESPRDPSHGDISTNVAMVLTKQARMKPRDIAMMVAEKLEHLAEVDSVEVAGPGFINLRLKNGFILERIKMVLEAGPRYGVSDIGNKEKVNVEYVSANPTGPMHVGHCRGAIFGDALAALLEFAGFDVTREYYINDAGAQIDVLARSAYLRYREALGEDIGEIPEGLYPGEYLIPVGQALAEKYGERWRTADEAEWLDPIREFATHAMMDMIREDLAALGIHHDVFFSEKTLHTGGGIEAAVEALRAKGLIYEGVLEPPKGKKPEDWEERPQLLFKASAFGDDIDRPLQKSDGTWTYFAADVAYHYDKVQRGFNSMIDVWGADHGGYVKRVKAAIEALTDGKGELDVRLCQLVNLLRDGKPAKMSKRAGTFVTLRDVVDEVGKDVVRFIMLTRKNDAALDFDFTKVMEQSKDNPVFYVQYAHARVHSVLKKAQESFPDLDLSRAALLDAEVWRLDDEAELGLVKVMAGWPKLVESAALAHEPHRIAFYLYDLASAFHTLWNKGNDNPDLKFIIEGDRHLTLARLAMISALANIIATGLNILGVEPVTEM